jgi:hypothetical protein
MLFALPGGLFVSTAEAGMCSPVVDEPASWFRDVA